MILCAEYVNSAKGLLLGALCAFLLLGGHAIVYPEHGLVTVAAFAMRACFKIEIGGQCRSRQRNAKFKCEFAG